MTARAAPHAPARRARARKVHDLGLLGQVLLGVLPTADGGPPPVLGAARAGVSSLVRSALGLLLGSAVGLLLVLVVAHAPQVPVLVVGFGVGTLLGFAAATVVASRSATFRKAGGVLLLASPLLVLLAPFVAIWAAILLLRRLPRTPPEPPAPGPEGDGSAT